MITLRCEWKDAEDGKSSALRAVNADNKAAVARIWFSQGRGMWMNNFCIISSDRKTMTEAKAEVERLLGVSEQEG